MQALSQRIQDDGLPELFEQCPALTRFGDHIEDRDGAHTVQIRWWKISTTTVGGRPAKKGYTVSPRDIDAYFA